MGVKAELIGRNDILVDGRKISGNAQFATKGRMFSHGTLMFDTEIEQLFRHLKYGKTKLNQKGLNRSEVVLQIFGILEEPMTIEQFRLEILKSIFEGEENIQYIELTEEDWDKIRIIERTLCELGLELRKITEIQYATFASVPSRRHRCSVYK